MLRIGVESVSFVQIIIFGGSVVIDGWLAGKRPSLDGRVDEMRAPRGAMAGHQEAYCHRRRRWGKETWRWLAKVMSCMLVPKIRHDGEGCGLV